jgi:molybdopterin-guanine dinucleotide biosynthesis protein A
VTGVLLVGGASTRFGSPKALATLGGRTLAEIGWETLASFEERIAVGKHEDGLGLPFELLDDASDVRAPIAGVVAGLRASATDVTVFLPVDCPRVTPDVLRALADACRDVAVPQTGPLPGAYRKSALPVLERRLERGELALQEALAELDAALVAVDEALLANVNTPEDLRSLA